MADQKQKDNFIAAAVHELRQPLNAVLGNIDLLDKRQYLVKHKGGSMLLSNALDCGEILLSLIGNVLDFKKLETG